MSDTTPRDQLEQIIYKHIYCDVRGPKMDCGMDYPSSDYLEFVSTGRLADAIIAAGWRPPARTVTTVEERAAVRRGTVVRSASGTIACRHDKWNAVSLGVGAPFDWTVLALPLTIIYEPEEAE